MKIERPNVTGRRQEIIVSTLGTIHAPRMSFDGEYVKRYGWWTTVCGLVAEHGWSQRRRYGYVTCRKCIELLERREQM